MTLIEQVPFIPGQPPAVPPVYFASITLEHFKCFNEPVTLDFRLPDGRPSRWTVILGQNGVGKTTILQALAGLCGRIEREERKGSSVRYLVGPAMGDPSWFGWHNSGLLEGNVGHKISARLHIGGIDEAPAPEPLEWFVSFKETGANTVTTNGTAVPPSKLGALLCYGYGASRLMAPSSRARTQRPDRDRIESLMAESIALPNAEEWLLEIDHASKLSGDEQQNFQSKFQTIKELLLRVLPDVQDLRVAVTRSQSSPTPVRVEFKTKHGWITISNLSLGYKTMIAWIVDLTRRLYERYPKSHNPIREPAIVLVDELDLHLHPQWQRTVIDYLTERFTQTQFIVTAHSPLVLHSGSPAKVILMEEIDGKVVANHDLDAIKGWRIDQMLTSDLFKLQSAHPPEIHKAIMRRSVLLGKGKLTATDEAEIAELNRVIHSVPSGDSEIERRAEDLIRRALKAQTPEGQ